MPRSVLLVGKGGWIPGTGVLEVPGILEVTGMLGVPGMLEVTGAVSHSCAAGRAGLSPSPNSLGWCRALVLEVFVCSV